jgi:hypothetical protein
VIRFPFLRQLAALPVQLVLEGLYWAIRIIGGLFDDLARCCYALAETVNIVGSSGVLHLKAMKRARDQQDRLKVLVRRTLREL